MSDLNPTEIYRKYRRKELDKALAVDYLKSIIESSSDEELRVRSVELLGEINLEVSEVFEFLERLVRSDTCEKVRLTSIGVVIAKFLEAGVDLLRWIFKHEQSSDILLEIYESLACENNALSKDLLLLMEEIVGKHYLIYYDLLPREAMGLELLGRHLCKLSPYSDLTKWKYIDLTIKNQEVISIEIESLYEPINSKFFKLFSSLHQLRLFDCKLNNTHNLSGLSSLMITGTEVGQLDSIDEVIALDNLTNLRNLDLSGNYIPEIKNLGNLTNLVKLNLSQNEISEIKGLENLKNLECLNLEHNNIKEIKNLENLVNLKELVLSENKDISEIKGLRKLRKLEILRLFNNYLIKEIKGLEDLKILRILDISNDSYMIDKEGYEMFMNLKSHFVREIAVEEIIKSAETIYAGYKDDGNNLEIFRDYVKEIKGLDTLTNLEELSLARNQISEIKALEKLKNLNYLNLSRNNITEIKGLENLKKLKTLILDNNHIKPIQGLEGLESDLGVYQPQKFVEYCYKKKMGYL